MRAETRIDYRLTLRGLPVRWTSRIESWEPGVAFVDRQEHGPDQRGITAASSRRLATIRSCAISSATRYHSDRSARSDECCSSSETWTMSSPTGASQWPRPSTDRDPMVRLVRVDRGLALCRSRPSVGGGRAVVLPRRPPARRSAPLGCTRAVHARSAGRSGRVLRELGSGLVARRGDPRRDSSTNPMPRWCMPALTRDHPPAATIASSPARSARPAWRCAARRHRIMPLGAHRNM